MLQTVCKPRSCKELLAAIRSGASNIDLSDPMLLASLEHKAAIIDKLREAEKTIKWEKQAC